MSLIDADTAQPGLTVIAGQQTKGKGQRGRKWIDSIGESVLMSLVIRPQYSIEQQFCFNMSVCLAIADIIQEYNEHWDVRIKWPNDIIINDKKAGGVLIENVIRGDKWAYSLVGIGVNILQTSLPAEIPYATSLNMEGGKQVSVKDIAMSLREKILEYTYKAHPAEDLLPMYHDVLFRLGQRQQFRDNKEDFAANIAGVTPGGQLQLEKENGEIINYTHGTIEWLWL